MRRVGRQRCQRAAFALATVAGLVTACSYDFDRFVREDTGGRRSDGGAPAAGRAGSGGAATTDAGHGGTLGTAGNASEDDGESGGATDEGGAAGSSEVAGPSAGRGAGGTSGGAGGTAGATSAGGKSSSSAGNTSAGQGGKTSAGAGGAPSAGHGGAASGGAAGASCTGSHATTYGGHCYFLVGDDTALDWPSAKTACAAHSSTTHLVTITSTAEQAALTASFFPSTTDTWIGLSLADVTKDPSSSCKLMPDTCPFKWVTGEKLDYTDWAMRSGSDDEPNYSGSCVRLQAADETWGDTGCSGKYRAICEDDE